jgi:hypothetical protein
MHRHRPTMKSSGYRTTPDPGAARRQVLIGLELKRYRDYLHVFWICICGWLFSQTDTSNTTQEAGV